MAQGIVPMCSSQMERMFNTTRIPGKDSGTGHRQGPEVGLSGRRPLPPRSAPHVADPSICAPVTKRPEHLRVTELEKILDL